MNKVANGGSPEPGNMETIEIDDRRKASTAEGEPKSIPLFFLFLCTLAMTALYANILTYHMTVNMVHSYGNGTEDDYEYYEEFHDTVEYVSDYHMIDEEIVNVTVHWRKFLSNPQKESLITVVPIGGVLGWFPVVFMYNHMGFRRCIVALAVMCIIPSMLIPICTSAKTYVLAIIVRIFQGFTLGAFIPYVCKLAVFIPFDHIAVPTIVFSYTQIAAFFSFPLSAVLSWSALGWHSAHYVAAIATFIIFVFFMFINFDDEFKERASHYGIMDALFNYERARSRLLNLRLPYLSIYQDLPIWANFAAAFGYFAAMQLYLQFGPTFLVKVAGLSMVSSGLLSMIPPFCNLLIAFLAYGVFPTLANTIPNKMRVFNSLGTIVPGVLYMLIGLFDAETQPGSVTALFIVASSLLGFCSCGFFRMCQLRSAQFHLFILLNLFIVNMGSMFLTSLFNVLIAKNNQYNMWAVIFVLHGAILIVTNIIFCLFASDAAAPWTEEGYEDTSIRPNREDPLPQRPL